MADYRGRKITLYVGSIPVELKYTRSGAETTSGLRQLNADTGNPIKLQRVDSATGAVVQSLVMGKDVGGSFVKLTDDELDAAFATKEMDIRMCRIEDIQDIPVERIKSHYWVVPQNETFWGMIGGRLKETGKQVRFPFVEGRQQREAILRFNGDCPELTVLLFPSEVRAPIPSGAKCKLELATKVDALFAKLSGTKMDTLDNVRDKVIEDLVVMKVNGDPIPVKALKAAKIEKTAEELLNASL